MKIIVFGAREAQISGNKDLSTLLFKLKSSIPHVSWIFDQKLLSRVVIVALFYTVVNVAMENPHDLNYLYK